MKYNDNGTVKNIVVKAGDTLPIGTIVDFDGDVIPDGYEEATEASDVVNSLEGNEIYRAPSVKAVNEVLNGKKSMGSILVEDITCKNLFGFIFESTTKNGITSTYADGILTLNGASTAQTDIFYSGKNFTMKANTPYTITGFYVSGTASDNISFYMQNSESWQGLSFNIKDQNVSVTRDETYTNKDLILNANKFIRIPSGATLNNFKIKIQLEKGSVATGYVEHKEFENKETYSKNEQVIGTWIGGKPLYRKTFNVTSPSQITSSEPILILGSDCSIVKYDGFLNTANKGSYPLNCWFSNTDYIYSYVTDSNVLRLKVSLENYANRPITVTLEYTKTTD